MSVRALVLSNEAMPLSNYRLELVRWLPWLKEIFPGQPWNPSVFLPVIWHVFTRHGMLDIPIYVIQLLGLALLLVRFEFYEAASSKFQILIYGSIWLIVLTVSVICCWIYLRLIYYTFRKRRLLFQQANQYGRMFVVSIIALTLWFGILSSYTLFTLAPIVLERIEEMEFPFVWKTLFCFTVFFRVSERILASIFVAFVLPISQKWADQLDTDREEMFLDLFPWKVFLFLHRILLLTTFFGKPWYLFDIFDDGVHLISLTFRIFAMVWLLVLVLYVGYRPAVLPSQQETQHQSVISSQEVNRKHEKVIGHLPLRNVSYPSGSELVTGVTQDFFPLKRCPPNSSPDASSSDALVAHCFYRLAYNELQ